MNQEKFIASYEKHLNAHEHMAVTKFDHQGFTVYISEGGPFNSDLHDPKNWYETAFALQKKDVFVYQPLIFDTHHDLMYNFNSRRDMRINSAVKAAILTIDDWKKNDN